MAIRVKQNGKWINAKAQQDLDTSLSIEGMAADAKAVGDKIDKLPIAVYEPENGIPYTEILGMRTASNIKISRTNNQVLISIELNDGEMVYYYLTLSSSGWPESIQSNNVSCPITWVGEF